MNPVRALDTRRVCDLSAAELYEVAVARQGFTSGDWSVELVLFDGHLRRSTGRKDVQTVRRDREHLERHLVEVELTNL